MAGRFQRDPSRMSPRELASVLRELTRTYLPDSRLPGRSTLARHFNVSDITVRRAIDQLVREGVLAARPRRGVFVRMPCASPIRQIIVILGQHDVTLFQQTLLLGVDERCRQRRVKFRILQAPPQLCSPDVLSQMADDDPLTIGWMCIDAVPPEDVLLAWQMRGVPLVLVDMFHPSRRVNFVGFDNLFAIYQATETLILLGHRRIAYCGPMAMGDSVWEARLRGFRLAHQRYQVDVDESLLLTDSGKAGRTVQRIREALAQPNRPAAIVAANQRMGCEILDACTALGLRVPEQISVIASGSRLRLSPRNIDNLSRFELAPPEQLGSLAVDVLLDDHRRRDSANILLGSTWIDCGSTGPLPGLQATCR